MRDGDSVSLIARLPWWRNDRLQQVRYGSEEAESKVLAAANAWLTTHQTSSDETESPAETAPVAGDQVIVIADASEVTTVDRAFASVPAPPVPAFWHSLLAILAGALAAAAAAVLSARYIFA